MPGSLSASKLEDAHSLGTNLRISKSTSKGHSKQIKCTNKVTSKLYANQAHGSPNYEIIIYQASRLGTNPGYSTYI